MSNQRVINLLILLLLRGLMMSVIMGKGCDGWVFELPRKLMTRESPEVSSPIPAPFQYYIETKERCSDPMVKRGCRDLTHNLAACLLSSSTSSRELFLLVQNDGEGILKVNLTITDIKVTFPEIQLSKHDAKKIDVSENIEGSPSIILYTGNGSCTIEMDSKKQKVKYEPFFGHGTYLSPKYGAYLFLIALISGGACACCWFLKSSHVDGVPYQELEMERPDSHSANNVETTGGWDEGWDDDWDEIKEVKQPNGHQTANVLSDVIASRNSDAEEGRKDWDD
ncbi:uncharacterized protein LOC7455237 isoform X1 [Populus trichocarpa]|uniref:uncharacterized protein LOC7455237 isoform X1 n=1 Tax=Populus trichocarpa TaxID=3694 RepID=UPI0022791F48|nr:uncharacterized protein LOC7455237 isoform X1 [Populus trichocarpa]